MTSGQVIAIVFATLGAVVWLLAAAMPNFERIFADWRLKLASVVLGFLMVLSGMWAAAYFAHKPKTLVESGREVLDKGSDAARDGMRRVKEALPRPSSWWPWSEKPAEKDKK